MQSTALTRALCTALLLVTTFISSDNEPLNAIAKQYTMMMRCVSPEGHADDLYSIRMWHFLRSNNPRNEDACTWRGVACVDTAVTSVLLASTKGSLEAASFSWIIDPDWFPSSAQFVHLRHVRLIKGWMAQRLPRDLRYFCISYGQPYKYALKRNLEVRYLPRRMEELHVHDGFSFGTLLITDLPQTMRLCFIKSIFIERAFVDNAQVPDSLEMFVVIGGDFQCKMKSLDGNAVDKRLVSSYHRSQEYSTSFQAFDSQCDATIRQVSAEQREVCA